MSRSRGITRRRVLLAGSAGLAATAGGRRWLHNHEGGLREDVFIAKQGSYGRGLTDTILRGLREIGVNEAAARGRRVLLKPNLVEPHPERTHVNTHPLFVRAAAEAFLRLGAEEVAVGEGQGHRRDSLLVLEDSGLLDVLQEDRIRFHDLNSDELRTVANQGDRTKFESLSFPGLFDGYDWIVSLPKMKTHHWAGATLSMKNLFGVMPGIVYGWPKNALHLQGIENSVVDIYATLRPQLSIVDGIVGMEGDGPIMGTAKQAGVIVMGRNFPAVDATCARVMGLRPEGVPYLQLSSGVLGPIRDANITQRGEPHESVRTDFQLVDAIPAHRRLRLATS